jgi:Reverse transcriptase (RNA-dependent DNA polymerase)
MRAARQTDTPHFAVFLDLKKAYDTLDRDRTLQILQGYEVGPNIRNIIAQTWAMDRMIPRQAGFYGEPFKTSRGVRQGDIMSPTVFNIVCDAVIRHCESATQCQELKSIFYADDGVLIGKDPAAVQKLLDIYTDAFPRVGLQMNVAKTKAMVIEPWKRRAKMSESVYLHKTTREGVSFAERMKARTTCPLCKTEVQLQYLKAHQRTRKCLQLWRQKKDSKPTQLPDTEDRHQENTSTPAEEPAAYTITDHTQCPAPSCPYKMHLTTAHETPLQKHAQTGHDNHQRRRTTAALPEMRSFPKRSRATTPTNRGMQTLGNVCREPGKSGSKWTNGQEHNIHGEGRPD